MTHDLSYENNDSSDFEECVDDSDHEFVEFQHE